MRGALFCAALLAVLAVPASLAAQSEASAPEGYAPIVDAAIEEFSVGRWAEARALFLQAHALFPNARTLRGVGMAAYEIGDYPAAVRALEEALTHAARPLSDEQREQVEALLSRARLLVGRFEVPIAPEGAHLFVDGEGADLDGWPSAPGILLLSVGEHRISIRAPSGRTASARVMVVGREDGPLDIDLAPLDAPPVLERVREPEPEREPERVIEPAPIAPASLGPEPWIVVGSGAALAVIGAILLGVGVADVAAVEGAPLGTPWPSLAGAYDRAPILTGVGGAAIGVGAAVAVGGVIWGASRDSTPEQRVELRLGGRW
jgi:hypothetical protein